MSPEITPLSLDREPPALGPFDRERAERAVRELLIAVGEDPDREGLLDTPARVARAYEEVFGGLRMTAEDVLTTTFDLGHDELIIVRDIELYSTCEHHLVPFHGVAHVGYIPGKEGRITGLSKLARLVDVYAKRPQVCRSASPRRSPMRSCASSSPGVPSWWCPVSTCACRCGVCASLAPAP